MPQAWHQSRQLCCPPSGQCSVLQKTQNLGMLFLFGNVRSCVAFFIFMSFISTMLKQQLHHLLRTFAGSLHQRGDTIHIRQVYIRARCYQNPCCISSILTNRPY